MLETIKKSVERPERPGELSKAQLLRVGTAAAGVVAGVLSLFGIDFVPTLEQTLAIGLGVVLLGQYFDRLRPR